MNTDAERQSSAAHGHRARTLSAYLKSGNCILDWKAHWRPPSSYFRRKIHSFNTASCQQEVTSFHVVLKRHFLICEDKCIIHTYSKEVSLFDTCFILLRMKLPLNLRRDVMSLHLSWNSCFCIYQIWQLCELNYATCINLVAYLIKKCSSLLQTLLIFFFCFWCVGY